MVFGYALDVSSFQAPQMLGEGLRKHIQYELTLSCFSSPVPYNNNDDDNS